MTTITKFSRNFWLRKAVNFYLEFNQWEKISCYGKYDMAYRKDNVMLHFQFKDNKNQDKQNLYAISIDGKTVRESRFNKRVGLMESIYRYYSYMDKEFCAKLFPISYDIFKNKLDGLVSWYDYVKLCHVFYNNDYDKKHDCNRTLKQLKNHTAKEILNRYYMQDKNQTILDVMEKSSQEFRQGKIKPFMAIHDFYVNILAILTGQVTLEELKQFNLF